MLFQVGRFNSYTAGTACSKVGPARLFSANGSSPLATSVRLARAFCRAWANETTSHAPTVLAVNGKPLHPLLAATGAIRRYSVLPSAYRPGSVNPLIRATVSLSTCVVPPFVAWYKRDYFVLSGTTRNRPEGIPVGGAGHLALFGLLWELNQGGAGGTRTPGLHSAIVALSQLSYSPVPMRRRIRMELMGLEPMTSTMPLWRSPN